MPASVTDAMKEAYAVAPADEVVIDTMEMRHPAFVNDAGEPDSLCLTPDEGDITVTLEANAPVRAGEEVRLISFPFTFTLAPVELSPAPEILLRIDGVDRRIIENLKRAASSSVKIEICYRGYLNSDRSAPHNGPLTTTLSNVKVDVMTVTARARVGSDLNRAFPRRRYTAQEFAALIGQ